MLCQVFVGTIARRASFHYYLNAVGRSRQRHVQALSRIPYQFKFPVARCDDRGLQSLNSAICESRRIREVASNSARSGAQAPVSVQLHGNLLGVSGHGYQLKTHRRLPGNPGNSTAHPCRVARRSGLGKWCSTFRTDKALRFYHTGHKRPVRAWKPPEKLYLRTNCPARRRRRSMRESNSCTSRLPLCFLTH